MTTLQEIEASIAHEASVKSVLDPCCGAKMCWFQKESVDTVFLDNRKESHILCDGRTFVVAPDAIADFRQLPFPDESFNLVLFDPPHLHTAGQSSWLAKKYGKLDKSWKGYLSAGFNECWRVLRYGGTMIFKWNETQIKVKEVLSCFSQTPLFGHTTTQRLNTHWMTFYKSRQSEADQRARIKRSNQLTIWETE